MGIELELIILLIIQILGSSYFAKFEIETPGLRKAGKWLFIAGVTISLYYWIGHYAVIFPIAMTIVGTIVHIRICRKNGIDPLRATPRKKYYQLRGWKWEE